VPVAPLRRSNASLPRSLARTFLPAALLLGGVVLLAADSRAGENGESLSELHVFNRVVLLVKEQYVEPSRIRPKEMLRATLDAVEKAVPEVLIEDLDDDSVKVSVGGDSRVFDIREVASLWELSFRLSSVFRFIEPRISAEVNKKDVEYAAVNGMLGKLDPHSVLLEPRFSQEMKLSTKGEFGGLGIVISVRDGGLTVISPIDGTPADGVGVKAQDKIVKIGEESTVNMGLDEAVERLRGKAGTTVTVWILRKGWEEPRRFDIVRAVIKVDSVSAERTGDYAYVKIKQFAGHVAEDVARGVEKAAGASKTPLKGMILDLRNNPGGLLDQAVGVADIFLDGGEVVSQRGRQADDIERYHARPGDMLNGLPVVVLVNSGSASAAEIVAGALQDRKRAEVVGLTSFGKGSVQQVIPLNNGEDGALKLTTARYFTPSGKSIQRTGIEPDLEVASTREQAELIATRSIQYSEAMLRNALDAEEGKTRRGAHTPAEAPPMTFDEEACKKVTLATLTITCDFQLQRAIDVLRNGSVSATPKLPKPQPRVAVVDGKVQPKTETK